MVSFSGSPLHFVECAVGRPPLRVSRLRQSPTPTRFNESDTARRQNLPLLWASTLGRLDVYVLASLEAQQVRNMFAIRTHRVPTPRNTAPKIRVAVLPRRTIVHGKRIAKKLFCLLISVIMFIAYFAGILFKFLGVCTPYI